MKVKKRVVAFIKSSSLPFIGDEKTIQTSFMLGHDATRGFLDKYGELERVESGNAVCKDCGHPVSVRSIGQLIKTDDGGLEFSCNTFDCGNVREPITE